MHILTKAFMVLATVLAVALSALVIAYAANTDKIRADYADEQARRAAVDAALTAQQSSANSQIVRAHETIRQLQSDLSDARAQLTALQNERKTLQTEKERAISDRTTTASKIDELSELARTQATLLEQYRGEVTGLRKNELTYKQRQLEMEDRLNDLQAQRDVLEQNYRALQEEITQLRRDTQLAGSGSGGSSGAAQPFVASGPIIMGRVESVQRDPASNRTFAKLSIGSNDRVAKNMLLRVVRGSEFVANVVVDRADLGYSIGTVDTLGKAVEVREGDTVVSRLQ